MTVTLQQPPHRHSRDIRTIALTATGSPIPVSGRLTGPETGPAVIVLGGISSGRTVADHDGEKGWWRDFVGSGKAVDTDRIRVLSFALRTSCRNLLGQSRMGPSAHDATAFAARWEST